MGIRESIIRFYDKKYKLLLVLSILLVLSSILVLGINYAIKGEFVDKGVSLKGGLSITIPVPEAYTKDNTELETAFKSKFPKADIDVRSITKAGRLHSFIVESAGVEEANMISALEEQGLVITEEDIEYIDPKLSKSFYRQTVFAIIIAFIAMALVVYITFRLPLPSSFVILAAVSDIVSTMAVISIIGIKLSIPGIAALLMLIGYSVDTDILLTTKVLKRREGTVFERLLPTVRTGMLMSLTSFTATMTAYLLVQSDIIKQIMLILSIGLLFDIIYTWCQNAGILRWHLEKKEKKWEK